MCSWLRAELDVQAHAYIRMFNLGDPNLCCALSGMLRPAEYESSRIVTMIFVWQAPQDSRSAALVA